jgi:hypothetical protein
MRFKNGESKALAIVVGTVLCLSLCVARTTGSVAVRAQGLFAASSTPAVPASRSPAGEVERVEGASGVSPGHANGVSASDVAIGATEDDVNEPVEDGEPADAIKLGPKDAAASSGELLSVPDCSCTTIGCPVACPLGDIELEVRFYSSQSVSCNIPLVGFDCVRLNLYPSGLPHCPQDPDWPYVYPQSPSDWLGRVFFATRLSGCNHTGGVELQSCGCQDIAIPCFRSVDVNGDGIVNNADVRYCGSLLETDDCCCDFNCDGTVDLNDIGIMQEHMYHTCTGVQPPPSIEAAVDFDPNTLNLKSKGNYVTCYIELPDGHDPADIDMSTVTINSVFPASLWPTTVGDYDGDGTPDRMVKFPRAGVIGLLGAADGYGFLVDERRSAPVSQTDGNVVEVTVDGELDDGTMFSGTDVIRLINPGGGSDGDAPEMSVSTPSASGPARISYRLAVPGPVSLRIFDAAGRLVRTLEADYQTAGSHTVAWDRRTDSGTEVGLGLYFVRLERRGKVDIQKLLILD